MSQEDLKRKISNVEDLVKNFVGQFNIILK